MITIIRSMYGFYPVAMQNRVESDDLFLKYFFVAFVEHERQHFLRNRRLPYGGKRLPMQG